MTRAWNRQKRPLSRQAFTLIELLVVIAIIAILADHTPVNWRLCQRPDQ